MSHGLQKLVTPLRAVAIGLAFLGIGSVVHPLGLSSVAWGQSTNPAVLTLIAAVRTAPTPMPQATRNAIAAQLNSWSSQGTLSANVAALFGSSGAMGGQAGINVSSVVTNAVVQVAATLPAAAQNQVGVGIGSAAVSLAAAGFGGSAKSVLSNLSGANSNIAAGLQSGVTQALNSIPVTSVSNPSVAIVNAAAGTSISAIVSTGANAASPTTTGNTNPVVFPIPQCAGGSCN